MANPEGPVSPLVIDSAKFQCSNCNGSKFYISKTIDDPNDVVGETVFAALDITITGGSFQGLVCLCVQCGVEQVPYWWLTDTGTSDGTTVTMSDLETGTLNLLAGLYMVYLGDDANDNEEYFVIASHTASATAVITTVIAPHADSDGEWMITNLLPVGKTAAA